MPRSQTNRAYRRVLAIAKLGGRCVRCGITYPLDIDHIKNDGGVHRAQVRANQRLAAVEEILLGVNLHLYQLLCPNCNALKERDPDTFWNKAPTYGMLPVDWRRPPLQLPLAKRLVYRWVIS
jgi:hypothetical protein